MIRRIFRFATLAILLAPINVSKTLYAETTSTFRPGEVKYENPSRMNTKTRGDKDSVNMPEKGTTKKYGPMYERKGDNTKTVQMAGNTNEKSDKGGAWVQRTHGGKWNLTGMAGAEKGPDGKLKGGLFGGAGAEYGGSIGVGAQTPKWGNEKWNIQGRITGELYGEVKATLEAGIKGGEDFIGATLEGEVGAAIGARGKVEGTVSLFGVPVTIRGEGTAMLGARAKAGGRIGLLKDESGRWKFVVRGGVGAAWGVGLEGNVTLEIDAEALCHVLGLDDLWKEFLESLKSKDNAKGDGDVTGDDLEGLGNGSSDGKTSNGNKSGYQGIKGLKAHKWGGK